MKDRLVPLLTHRGQFPLHEVLFAFRWGEDVFKRFETFATKEECERYMDQLEYPTEWAEHPRLSIPIRFFNEKTLLQYLERTRPGSIHVEFPEHARPLVFDVDISDYIPHVIRLCGCSDPKSVCNGCWVQIMRPAMCEAQRYLRDFLRFEEVMFVFSGRKGFHIWVTDERVWSWSLEARQNYAERMPLRLDMQITVGKRHLIKVPWGRHQTTGKLCCEIHDLETFLPF